FEFAEALADFEDVAHMAPDWLPGRINLAIALMNVGRCELTASRKEETNVRARALFKDVLKRDPNNPYAHFCLGLMFHTDENPEPREHFLAVTRADDHDPAAWFWLGSLTLDNAAEAGRCFQRALDLDPNYNAARFALYAQLGEQGREAEAHAALDEFHALEIDTNWERVLDTRYSSNWGKYALAIGTLPKPPTVPRFGPLPLF